MNGADYFASAAAATSYGGKAPGISKKNFDKAQAYLAKSDADDSDNIDNAILLCDDSELDQDELSGAPVAKCQVLAPRKVARRSESHKSVHESVAEKEEQEPEELKQAERIDLI